ncbi:ATP-binding cassette domain-containing protein [Treponema pedis]|uniref:ATP-binding cassette domain-containing protein n=1 Tax=Treponema pedis TaxID=409322 RepID=UPI00197F37C7|nr:ATP-binding cassette domain-containing protein [Treponema pedis]QSI04348.1 ATP-binding cassette domain-containing protein [Treponema pedis]
MKKNGTAELSGICKTYKTENKTTGEIFTNTALTDVNIKFFTSEIHALLGENGAGKSTLVNILSGLIPPTGGLIKIADKTYSFNSPNDALNAGIAIVHQQPRLAENATVFENIIIGAPKKNIFSVLNIKSEKQKIEDLKSLWKVRLNLNECVKNLSSDKKFYTAMFSALYRNPAFLILDEPAAVFSKNGRAEFFTLLKTVCKEKSLGVILITHNVSDAINASDKISVLKNGKLHGTFLTSVLIEKNGAEDFIKEKMFLKKTFLNLPDKKNGDTLKSKISFTVSLCFNKNKIPFVNNFKLQAKQGKITGVIGFPNSGLELLENIISGMSNVQMLMAKEDSKNNFIEINTLNGNTIIPIKKITPSVLLKHKIAFIPSDRNYRASNSVLTIEEILNCYNLKKNFLNKREFSAFAEKILKEENINAVPGRLAGTLSGGQLQRIILSRALSENPEIIIACEPAWGLDAATTEMLMKKFHTVAENGKTVIILTKEFDTALYKNYFDAVYFLGRED